MGLPTLAEATGTWPLLAVRMAVSLALWLGDPGADAAAAAAGAALLPMAAPAALLAAVAASAAPA